MNAGEIGHMLLSAEGPKCGCGNRGCLESLASRRSIARDIALAIKSGESSKLTNWVNDPTDLDKIRSKSIAKAYRHDDALVCAVVNRAAKYIGMAIRSLIHLLGVRTFVLGGGLVEAIGDSLLNPIQDEVNKCLSGTAEDISIRISKLGDHAGILGAAALAQSRLCSSKHFKS